MSNNTSIKRLMIWGNKAGNIGARCIADMLEKNNVLEILCINDIDISLKGVEHLARGLSANRSLKDLSLRFGESYDDEYLKVLSEGLSGNSGLTTLDLAGGYEPITNTGLIPLEKALRTNYRLEIVKMMPSLCWQKDPIRTGCGSHWHKISYWLRLNESGRKQFMATSNVSDDELIQILLNGEQDINSLFFFLRLKPYLCNYMMNLTQE